MIFMKGGRESEGRGRQCTKNRQRGRERERVDRFHDALSVRSARASLRLILHSGIPNALLCNHNHNNNNNEVLIKLEPLVLPELDALYRAGVGGGGGARTVQQQ